METALELIFLLQSSYFLEIKHDACAGAKLYTCHL